MLQQRAQALLMSNEKNALQQLDAILTSSQDNLLAQRDRFTAIGNAVRRRSGAMLVVLLRADSSTSAGQMLGTATLQVDNASVDIAHLHLTANSALRMGAVDQLYRANVLPTGHTVTLQLTVNGQPMTQTVNVERRRRDCDICPVRGSERSGRARPHGRAAARPLLTPLPRVSIFARQVSSHY